ncbi:MAG TPA: class I SAM-dependent methyltransferase [Terriglobia bacterium]|nr:class I SAM-dependent methyltransferase [Terriglobia bacterium]
MVSAELSRRTMIHTLCAICESDTSDDELYADRLGADAATYGRFSARRQPDRIHYRMVRCRKCGLIRSDPVLPEEELGRLYRGSAFTYEEESGFARLTYARYLKEAMPLFNGRARMLEIGCGNGFFLEKALELGFAEAHGVEPSREAVESAPPAVRNRIKNDLFQEGMFPPGWFSLICGFQVLDHLTRPNEVLRTCRAMLEPGGVALFINHDAAAWTNRILGERSPIIDIEHTYLYDKKTMARIFRKNGFEVLRVFSVRNEYPLAYWWKMAPIPGWLKAGLQPALKRSRFGRWVVSMKAGNLGILARAGGQ